MRFWRQGSKSHCTKEWLTQAKSEGKVYIGNAKHACSCVNLLRPFARCHSGLASFRCSDLCDPGAGRSHLQALPSTDCYP
eukprot:6172512-Pleurochrysis_carterae.AAC.4